MNRAELLTLRTSLQKRVAERKRLGDFDTNAAAIRESLESTLALCDHILSRMSGRDEIK